MGGEEKRRSVLDWATFWGLGVGWVEEDEASGIQGRVKIERIWSVVLTRWQVRVEGFSEREKRVWLFLIFK